MFVLTLHFVLEFEVTDNSGIQIFIDFLITVF
jgi:hypothetical protein